VADDVDRGVSERRAELVQAVAGRAARDDDGVGVGDEGGAVAGQGGGVDQRLGAGAAAVEADARAGVAVLAARAVLPARVHAGADGADEPVVVQVQDDLRAGVAGCGESARAERRVRVVGVDDAGTGAAHDVRDLPGVVAAAQEVTGRGHGRERPRVALEELDLLAEVLATSQARSATARSSPPGMR
jgi:hypothetical protein